MWPWEHLAFAYLFASAFSRLAWRSPPTDAGAFAIAFGALLPDLVDKPLAWGLGVLPSGRSLAHSLLVVLPLIAVVLLLARRRGATRVAALFSVATLSHLAGDVVYPLVTEGDLRVEFLVWPLLSEPSAAGTPPLVGHVYELFAEFVALLTSARGALFVGAEAALIVAAIAVWVLDDAPGLALPRRS